ncbi:PLP-dependent transferase [Aquabacterium sp. OR-4]|uniref:PLP-dependent transferase n=1 Tax=Aquabacterium sp. OR-4 TaxID=2978127 RepID=UPI0021B16F46|nr:PLP-dependent transferase [Aquabacterium sp. OR-4]MDT7834822.1 PLP-dependent transferase [Aquabacterium sp. OR-4]
MPDSDDLITGLIHHPYQPPEGWAAVPPGVFKASTVIFPSVAALRGRSYTAKTGYTYGLRGTPTTYQLEERLATLEGGRHCILSPSGLAAITHVNLALLGQGDELLLPANVYGPSADLAASVLARWGITHQLYDPMNPADLAARITERTKLVWLEAAGSVTMEFPDLTALVAAARARGVLTALDNTWGAGLAFRAFDLGVDVVMHALTKYPSGGADVLMGAVLTRDDRLHQRLLRVHGQLGLGVAANDAELVLRGLPTLALRYHAHDAAARQLAAWLASQPGVTRVLHPALPGAPGHAHWAAHCTAAAGLFSVLLDPGLRREQVDAFVDALRLFKIGFSWGGPVSLVVPYELDGMRADRSALPGHLVRLSIGLEAVADLQADLAQALALLARP